MSEHILNLLPLKEGEREEFEALAPDAVHTYARRTTVTPEQLAAATIIFGWPRAQMMHHAVNLKWFQTMWVGTDEYEKPGILREGAVFTNSSGFNARSVAEHMLAMVMSLCRGLPAYRDNQNARLWGDEGKMKTLFASTVLVLGTGNIGSTFAKMCKDLGAKTVGVNRSGRPAVHFDETHPMTELDALLPQADFVALVMPHTPETVKLMNRERIAMLKDDAVLISCGRGTVLDQDALVEAMQAGKLWGAGMDVTDPEPLPADHPLWGIPNLILTPHVAGGMRLELTRRTNVEMALDNLRRYMAGEELKNRVR